MRLNLQNIILFLLIGAVTFLLVNKEEKLNLSKSDLKLIEEKYVAFLGQTGKELEDTKKRITKLEGQIQDIEKSVQQTAIESQAQESRFQQIQEKINEIQEPLSASSETAVDPQQIKNTILKSADELVRELNLTGNVAQKFYNGASQFADEVSKAVVHGENSSKNPYIKKAWLNNKANAKETLPPQKYKKYLKFMHDSTGSPIFLDSK